MKQVLGLEGIYQAQHWRNGKMIREINGHNGITLEGKGNLLLVYFNLGVQPTAWYCGLLDSPFTPADPSDDLTVIAADEFTEYECDNGGGLQGADRKSWPADSPPQTENDGGTDYVYVENSTTYMEYDITGLGAATDVWGIFMCTNAAVKLATGGQLWSTAPFNGGAITVDNGDTLKVKYKIRIPY
jgi:hypothetical protein